MSPDHKLYAGLYIAWSLLLLAIIPIQKTREGRMSCFLAACGFGLLLGNLFIPEGGWHMAVRVLGLVVLVYAGTLPFRANRQPAL